MKSAPKQPFFVEMGPRSPDTPDFTWERRGISKILASGHRLPYIVKLGGKRPWQGHKGNDRSRRSPIYEEETQWRCAAVIDKQATSIARFIEGHIGPMGWSAWSDNRRCVVGVGKSNKWTPPFYAGWGIVGQEHWGV